MKKAYLIIITVFLLSLTAVTSCDFGDSYDCSYDGVNSNAGDSYLAPNGCDMCFCSANGMVTCTTDGCR